jgi:peptide-methionine (R)-S-oxide reductase
MSDTDSIPQTEEEWRDVLTDEEYRILREKGTEPRFSGEHIDTDEDGVFRCAACDAELFDSETKFGSNTGWPSFYEASEDSIEFHRDTSHGMDRTEVVCARCGGHLGHVFDDGPDPTGKRYCINSVSLEFESRE